MTLFNVHECLTTHYECHHFIVQFVSPLKATVLLLIRQVLLHHAANLAISIKVLSYCAVLVKWPSNFLCSSSNGAIGYGNTRQPSCPIQRYISELPLNIEPTVPCLSNMLVPVPCVFSPAAGCLKISIRAYQYRAEKAYSLLNRFVKTASHLIFFESRVGALLKGLGCIVTVHCEFAEVKVLVKRP